MAKGVEAKGKSNMIGTLILGLLAILLLSAGQTLLKFGLNSVGGVSLAQGLATWLKLLQTPWVLVGLACYALSTILWLDVLSKLDFSLAFPLMGLNYVFILLIGHYVFHEEIGASRILGVALVLAGILFLLRSGGGNR